MSNIESPIARTAFEVLKEQDKEIAKRCLVARVNGNLVDLTTPVNPTDTVEAIMPETRDGLEVYRHSSAHLLAAAVLELFPKTKLGIGPALLDDPKGGFFYDFQREERFSPEDLQSIEKKMKELVKQNLPYRRVEIPKAEALEKFNGMGEDLKCELISDKGGDTVSCYTLGNTFIDFCLGPHVNSTSKIKAFKLLSLAGAYWLGDNERPQMQRIYGISFPTQEELDAWLKQREEAERRDHRRLGRELDLFSVQEVYGPGMIFWHPKGGIIRKEIEDFLREQLVKRGYGLVFTPQIAKRELWKISGHEENYADSMFAPMEMDEQHYRIRPMNCPFHIGIYKSTQRSYRELPLRYAEFGTVYRYELAGALHGLLRVRGFTQDDAHLFCTPQTICQEVRACIDFTRHVYETFGFSKYKVELSVRGDETNKKYIGSEENWKLAEDTLVEALAAENLPYERIEGEAAFYGPKIDFKVVDAIGRMWQLSTIQVDFNLPERFNMEYIGSDNQPHRPIMLHRALLGSVERFFGILIEHFEGKFPFWLSPLQVRVLPITDRQNEYAQMVLNKLQAAGIRADGDFAGEKVGAKIRNAQLERVCFMLVIGDREAQANQVAVRERGRGDIGAISIDEFISRASKLITSRTLTNDEF
ncbi:MAG: threonine--tRNA ligase [Blastocatellia bacterium]|nr:threonine--tRNA ligase [Blastocatellia bacterium]